MAILNEILEREKTIEILRNYSGTNPYLLKLKNDVFSRGKTDITDFNYDYIKHNYDFEPKLINKTVKVADWYSKKLKEEWNLDFLPEKILIKYYLGETEKTYHCLIKYRQNMDYIYAFLSKKGILTNFLVEDYNKIDVDFDRYDKLSSVRKPESNRKIKEHQKEAVKFLLSRKKCILALDMGAGKTASLSVAAIEGNFDSVLVICPASLKTTWFNELSYYVSEREISIIGGTSDFKKSELEQYLGYSVGKSNKTITELQEEAKIRGKWDENRFVIVNYDILDEFYKLPLSRKKIDIENAEKNSPMLNFVKDKKWLLIVDESHRLSNMKSQQYKIISNLIKKGKPHSVYLATGTPITNNPQNLYNVLSLIENDITSDWREYMRRYCGAIEIPKNNEEREKRNRISQEYIQEHKKRNWYDLTEIEKKELNDIISKNCKMNLIYKEATNLDELKERIKHIYLRRTKDEFGELPQKYIYERSYELTNEQRKEYEKLWDAYVKEKETINPNIEDNKDLLEGGLYRRYLSTQMVPHTISLAEKCLKKGEKVIIFCCYDEELYLLRDYFKDVCVIYNGKVSPKEKDNAVKKFMTDENCKVFIGNLYSAGVGLTLTASRVVIFNSFSFVPSDNRQGEDRVHRFSQTRDVYIFYQFFKNTQYEKMWEIVLKKELVINKLIKTENEK